MLHSKTILCLALFSTFAFLVGCSPAGNSAEDTPEIPAFDSARAFALLQQQVDIGPRYPGSAGHKTTLEMMESSLKQHADSVRRQTFSRSVGGKNLEMTNLIAHFNPSARKWVLLAAHWDTRPIADQEVLVEKRKQPIPGANDGASGVAVLLELARLFAQRKPDVGIVMVFFDGEDYGPGREDMFMGSEYFAANLPDGLPENVGKAGIEYGILLDMIGDKNLTIHQEANSVEAAPEVVEKVWGVARKLGYEDVFIPAVKHTIHDDHIPLIAAGIKCIDVIDFDYGPWHTLEDTPEQCSPKSLKIVGEVVAHTIYQEPGE